MISALIVGDIHKFVLIKTVIRERDFKSEYFCGMCAVATNPVTTLEIHSDFCYYALPFIANYGRVPYPLIFNPIAALLQEVLQENTEPFGNGLLEMRNTTV